MASDLIEKFEIDQKKKKKKFWKAWNLNCRNLIHRPALPKLNHDCWGSNCCSLRSAWEPLSQAMLSLFSFKALHNKVFINWTVEFIWKPSPFLFYCCKQSLKWLLDHPLTKLMQCNRPPAKIHSKSDLNRLLIDFFYPNLADLFKFGFRFQF